MSAAGAVYASSPLLHGRTRHASLYTARASRCSAEGSLQRHGGIRPDNLRAQFLGGLSGSFLPASSPRVWLSRTRLPWTTRCSAEKPSQSVNTVHSIDRTGLPQVPPVTAPAALSPSGDARLPAEIILQEDEDLHLDGSSLLTEGEAEGVLEIEPEESTIAFCKDESMHVPSEMANPPPKKISSRYAPKDGSGIIFPPYRGEDELSLEYIETLSKDDILVADGVFNAELSWLSFNWRVLHMALNQDTPLYERLRFIAITARNLDEFFAKRVGGLKRQDAAGLDRLKSDRRGHLKWTPGQQLKNVTNGVRAMLSAQSVCLINEILPSLKERGLWLELDYEKLNAAQRSNLRTMFKQELEPVLTPLAVDPGHPFPFLGSLSLSIAVILRDPFDGQIHFAIVNVPSTIPRWQQVTPVQDTTGADLPGSCYVPIERVIIDNLDVLFGGMDIMESYVFRVTRNADVLRNEEEAEDLLEMITEELRDRRLAPFVRLEVDDKMPTQMMHRLADVLAVDRQLDVYTCTGPLAFGELDSLPLPAALQMDVNSNLLFPPFSPTTARSLSKVVEGNRSEIFDLIRSRDLLVHHPYHSFATSTQMFIETAARDPQVVAIKATLYRTSSNSPVIAALALAAELGKQVAVLVELKARFDEERNVGFAQRLEDAGCNVAYGMVGLKTHSKATMVVRKEEGGFRIYVHIGTGNYNPSTAGVYSDLGFFSCNKELGLDVANLFKYLTGYHRQNHYNKLLVAPNTMLPGFLALMDREIKNAQEGKEAWIIAKMNGLDDTDIASKLYDASAAGVHIVLIVRGVCRVRPGIKGLSENVTVISVIGRFLEHDRIYVFANGGDPAYYIGSADWMTRNLRRRIEVVTPVEDPGLKEELRDILDTLMNDRVNAWYMTPDGRYELQTPTAANAAKEGKGKGNNSKKKNTLLKDAKLSKMARMAASVGAQAAMIEDAQIHHKPMSKKSRKNKGRIRFVIN
eukprot:jgi/Mesvir1/26246/Mv05724-RA.1